MKEFTLEIISQEKHLGTHTVASVTLPSESGQITVLADHLPLFSRLVAGELIFKSKSGNQFVFAITGGFVDVSPRNIVTVLADVAIRSDQINLQKAEQAVANAKKALEEAGEIKDTFQMEIELRNALLQLKVAKKYQDRQN